MLQWVHMHLLVKLSLAYGDMLVIAATLIAVFVLGAMFNNDVDDDDNGPDGGLMTPVYNPI